MGQIFRIFKGGIHDYDLKLNFHLYCWRFAVWVHVTSYLCQYVSCNFFFNVPGHKYSKLKKLKKNVLNLKKKCMIYMFLFMYIKAGHRYLNPLKWQTLVLALWCILTTFSQSILVFQVVDFLLHLSNAIVKVPER